MKSVLKELRNKVAQPAVSIFVTTHRKHPENEQDSIALKNQLKIAEERITNEYDKRTATTILENIQAKTDNLDHNYNLDTLAIFASIEDAQVLRLPIDVKERVIIDERYATRDLIRDMASAVHYYAVVLGRDHARLIEASNNRVVKEFEHDDAAQQNMENMPFPIENNSPYKTGDGSSDRSANKENSYLTEYFNRIDKSVQELWGEHQMPLVLVGDNRNISYYKEVCDRPENIIASVSNVTDLENGSAQHIIEGVQQAVEAYRRQLHTEALGEIEKASGSNLIRMDLQEIYQAAVQGAGDTLYLRQGYIQPAIIDEKALTLTPHDDPAAENVTDDAVGEIIEHVLHNGGKAVFLPKDIMGEDQPIVLVTRY